MARPLRIEFPGAFYHITSRGIEKRKIFLNDKDYRIFLKLLKKMVERYSINLYAYVLMDNHYHLLLETRLGNLSKMMHDLNSSYITYFNKEYNRVGPLLQGRYKSILVEKDSYLLELVRYLHLNPVRAKLVDDIADYPWSSYKTYIRRENIPWLKREEVLSLFSENIESSIEKFNKFIMDGIRSPVINPFRNLKAQSFLGNDAFVNKMKSIFAKKKKKEISPKKELKKLSPLPVVGIMNILNNEFKEKEKKIKKKIAMYLLREINGLNLNEIKSFFGIHYSVISRHIKEIEKLMLSNEKFKSKIENIRDNILIKNAKNET
ncbi:MAG: transposase [Acidobacteriota bacterium]